MSAYVCTMCMLCVLAGFGLRPVREEAESVRGALGSGSDPSASGSGIVFEHDSSAAGHSTTTTTTSVTVTTEQPVTTTDTSALNTDVGGLSSFELCAAVECNCFSSTAEGCVAVGRLLCDGVCDTEQYVFVAVAARTCGETMSLGWQCASISNGRNGFCGHRRHTGRVTRRSSPTCCTSSEYHLMRSELPMALRACCQQA